MSTMIILSMYISRLSEQMIIFNISEFDFLLIIDKFTTGSSIRPQKKNPYTLELIWRKTNKIICGPLVSIGKKYDKSSAQVILKCLYKEE